MSARARPIRRAQRGVAVITALLLTTLAVTIVASLFWQQQVQVRSMENQRLNLQTRWILRGALDWGRLILRQDGLTSGPQTTLDGVWATPLAETRLDQYIERERVEGEKFDASLSGYVTDAQARYNLRNLVETGAIQPDQLLVLRRLFQNLRIDPSLAKAVADAMLKTMPPAPPPDPSRAPTPPKDRPMQFVQLDDLLSVAGMKPEDVAKLRDFMVVLPETTMLNVNTAPAELLAAVVDFTMQDATALVMSRKQASFTDKASFKVRLHNKAQITEKIDVRSNYFLVNSRVRLDRAALDAQGLIYRDMNNNHATSLVWLREN